MTPLAPPMSGSALHQHPPRSPSLPPNPNQLSDLDFPELNHKFIKFERKKKKKSEKLEISEIWGFRMWIPFHSKLIQFCL
jgi:hypothetical protein